MNSVRPVDFFSESPPERIIGTEMETSVQARYGDDSDQLNQELLHNWYYRNLRLLKISNFLSNGYKLYDDCGLLEIASPECLGPKQAAIYDFAGISIVSKIASSSPIVKGVYRTTGMQNIEGGYISQGYHENYLVASESISTQLLQTILASFLISKTWSGAGTLKNGFQLSQKFPSIGGSSVTNDMSRRTQEGNKPMIMLPEIENNDSTTIGNDNNWSRIEIRSSDANFSKSITYLNLATTSLILRLFEHPNIVNLKKLHSYSFKNILEGKEIFNSDLTFSKTLQTQNNNFISAINYQQLLLDSCRDLSNRINLPDSETNIFNLWQEVIDNLTKANLENNEYANLLELVGFAGLHYYLTKKNGSNNLKKPSYETIKAQLLWNQIYPSSGPAQKYWSKVSNDNFFIKDSDITQAIVEPPLTRANRRASLIKTHYSNITLIDWAIVSINRKDDIKQLFELNNPYEF